MSTLKEMTREMVEYKRRIRRKSMGKFFRHEKLYLKRRKAVDFIKQLILINGRDRASVGESASQFDGRPISDKRLGFNFIARVRRGFDFYRSLDFNPMIAM